MKKADKARAKLSPEVEGSAVDEAKLDAKKAQLDSKILAAKNDEVLQQSVLKAQSGILQKLAPKISKLKQEISTAELSLIEVKSKIKEYQ